MTTTDEYRQKLVAELIDQSAKIDVLVVKSRQEEGNVKSNYNQELEELRGKQRETTQRLHELEDPNSAIWENIGDGGWLIGNLPRVRFYTITTNGRFWPMDRGRERLSLSPPSEPGVRFSRDGLSSQL